MYSRFFKTKIKLIIMVSANSYVYFALSGDDFDPKIITERIKIEPTDSWRKGDSGKYSPSLKYSSWRLSTEKGKEYYELDKLVDEIITKLNDKIEIINQLKKELNLHSILEIVLDVDTNTDQPTPALGHDMKTISFLFHTNTTTDVDIYRFNSKE